MLLAFHRQVTRSRRPSIAGTAHAARRSALPRERFSPMARFGHAAMSDMRPLCAPKRKLNVTTIWIALALLCLALIVAAALTPKQTSIQGGHYSLGVYRTNPDGLAALVEQHMGNEGAVDANGFDDLAIAVTHHPSICPNGYFNAVGHYITDHIPIQGLLVFLRATHIACGSCCASPYSFFTSG